MPKPAQGIATAEGSIKININKMFKDGCFKSGMSYGNMSWSNGSNINYQTCFTEDEKFIRLIYTHTDYNGNKIKKDYNIHLNGIDSNLGNGKVYYFVCPVSYRNCRILYKSYGSEYFKSRTAYKNRIYYLCQTKNKSDYANSRYFSLKEKFDELIETNFRVSYKGEKTRTFKKLERLTNKINFFNYKRFSNLEYIFSKFKSKI